MEISLNEQKEANTTTIDFISPLGEKVGQLEYEIINDKAIIYNTYIYPKYRRNGILKSCFPTILSIIKQSNISQIELSVLSEDAKRSWICLGFTETRQNFLRMDL